MRREHVAVLLEEMANLLHRINSIGGTCFEAQKTLEKNEAAVHSNGEVAVLCIARREEELRVKHESAT